MKNILYSKDDRNKSDIKQLNQNNEFDSYEGITILCDIDSNENISNMMNNINDLENTCLKLLPYDSLHVTISPVITRKDFDSICLYNDKIDTIHEQLLILKKYLDDISHDDIYMVVPNIDSV